MLSRVAESLYWISRNVERAENITRILNVNFHALLDQPVEEGPQAWQSLVAITGDEAIFREHFDQRTSRSVTEFLLWHPANPNAVLACIARARENARSIREQIPNEMWERLNRFYLTVRDVDRQAVLRGPNEFFEQVREGSSVFQGVTEATMTHDEAYEFIRVGLHLERAEKTVRILDMRYAGVASAPERSAAASLQLMAMLRSCAAFESFRRSQRLLETRAVLEYLLQARDFPRAVLFCCDVCLNALRAISGDPEREWAPSSPERTLGRLHAELAYLEIRDVLGSSMHRYLDELLLRLNQAGDELTRTYFNTQVVLPSPRSGADRQRQQQQ